MDGVFRATFFSYSIKILKCYLAFESAIQQSSSFGAFAASVCDACLSE